MLKLAWRFLEEQTQLKLKLAEQRADSFELRANLLQQRHVHWVKLNASPGQVE